MMSNRADNRHQQRVPMRSPVQIARVAQQAAAVAAEPAAQAPAAITAPRLTYDLARVRVGDDAAAERQLPGVQGHQRPGQRLQSSPPDDEGLLLWRQAIPGREVRSHDEASPGATLRPLRMHNLQPPATVLRDPDPQGSSGGFTPVAPGAEKAEVIKALGGADGKKDYVRAYLILDKMWIRPMLPTLAELQAAGYLDELIANLGRAEGIYHNRLRAAMEAVRYREAPQSFSESFQRWLLALEHDGSGDQVEEIRQFVGKATMGQIGQSGRTERLRALRGQIDELLASSRGLRERLHGPLNAEARGGLETALASSRERTIPLLEERVHLLTQEVDRLEAQGGDEAELNSRKAELAGDSEQLSRLRRWKMRLRITAIEEKIGALGPNDKAERAKLERERRALGLQLSRTAANYKQYDDRWGNENYPGAKGKILYNANKDGIGKHPATIAEGGCGPISLAMILNMFDQEDPEHAVPDGPTIVRGAVQFAADKARGVEAGDMAHGTSRHNMAQFVGQAYAGLKGIEIPADAKDRIEQINAALNSGKLVMWEKPGHFVVLRSVSEDGKTYHVLDPGSGKTSASTATREDVKNKRAGYWYIDREAW